MIENIIINQFEYLLFPLKYKGSFMELFGINDKNLFPRFRQNLIIFNILEFRTFSFWFRDLFPRSLCKLTEIFVSS